MSVTNRDIQNEVIKRVIDERDRQDRLYGDECLSADPYQWLRILMEEVGEVAQDISRNDSVDSVEEELIQVAAVAIGWLEDIKHEKAIIKEYAEKWDKREHST